MIVNGEFRQLGENDTLRSFLECEGYDISIVAVERNGNIVPRSQLDVEKLSDDDRLEIITFVGGG